MPADFSQYAETIREYYQPEDETPLLNHGFQNWNMLVLNMLNWLEGKEPVAEF